MKNWREKGRMIRSKEKENFKQASRKTACFIHMTFKVMTLLMPSNLWNLTGQRTRRPSQRPYGSKQDDGDAGDDDVSSDDNTDILSSL